MGPPNCHGLDHHLGVKLWNTRSDVTRRCGKMKFKSPPKRGLGRVTGRAKVWVRLGQPLPLANLLLWPLCRIASRSPTYPPHARFENPLSQASGDLRLLLTFTYHGCPRFTPYFGRTPQPLRGTAKQYSGLGPWQKFLAGPMVLQRCEGPFGFAQGRPSTAVMLRGREALPSLRMTSGVGGISGLRGGGVFP